MIANYCSQAAPILANANSSIPNGRYVNATTSFTCNVGYMSSGSVAPYYICKPYNASSGYWQVVNYCSSMKIIMKWIMAVIRVSTVLLIYNSMWLRYTSIYIKYECIFFQRYLTIVLIIRRRARLIWWRVQGVSAEWSALRWCFSVRRERTPQAPRQSRASTWTTRSARGAVVAPSAYVRCTQ